MRPAMIKISLDRGEPQPYRICAGCTRDTIHVAESIMRFLGLTRARLELASPMDIAEVNRVRGYLASVAWDIEITHTIDQAPVMELWQYAWRTEPRIRRKA